MGDESCGEYYVSRTAPPSSGASSSTSTLRNSNLKEHPRDNIRPHASGLSRPPSYHLALRYLQTRKTMTETPAPEGAPAPAVTFKKRGARPKTNIRKREKPESDSSSSEDDAAQSRKSKKRQQGPEAGAKKPDDLFATVFEAERNVDLGATNDATKERTKIGPTQASTNVRMTTMIDYAPDVCKDVCPPSAPLHPTVDRKERC